MMTRHRILEISVRHLLRDSDQTKVKHKELKFPVQRSRQKPAGRGRLKLLNACSQSIAWRSNEDIFHALQPQ